jgi:hypothetical protein
MNVPFTPIVLAMTAVAQSTSGTSRLPPVLELAVAELADELEAVVELAVVDALDDALLDEALLDEALTDDDVVDAELVAVVTLEVAACVVAVVPVPPAPPVPPLPPHATQVAPNSATPTRAVTFISSSLRRRRRRCKAIGMGGDSNGGRMQDGASEETASRVEAIGAPPVRKARPNHALPSPRFRSFHRGKLRFLDARARATDDHDQRV